MILPRHGSNRPIPMYVEDEDDRRVANLMHDYDDDELPSHIDEAIYSGISQWFRRNPDKAARQGAGQWLGKAIGGTLKGVGELGAGVIGGAAQGGSSLLEAGGSGISQILQAGGSSLSDAASGAGYSVASLLAGSGEGVRATAEGAGQAAGSVVTGAGELAGATGEGVIEGVDEVFGALGWYRVDADNFEFDDIDVDRLDLL